jgi:hypothetical protein
MKFPDVTAALHQKYTHSVCGMTGSISIVILGADSLPPEFWQDERIRCASSICFSGCSFSSLPPVDTDFGLTSVHFIDCLRLEEFPAMPFAALARVQIWNCPVLTLIPPKMCSVKHMTIEKCPRLRKLSSLTLDPANLLSLVIRDCQRLAKIPDFFDKTDKIASVNISNCPILERMPPTFAKLKRGVKIVASQNGSKWPQPHILLRGPRAIKQFLTSIST